MANIAKGVKRVKGFAVLPAGDYLFRFDDKTGVKLAEVATGKNKGSHRLTLPLLSVEGPVKNRRHFHSVNVDTADEEQIGRFIDVLYNLNPDFNWDGFDYPDGGDDDEDKVADMNEALDECEVYGRIKHGKPYTGNDGVERPNVNLVETWPSDTEPEGFSLGGEDDEGEDNEDDEPPF